MTIIVDFVENIWNFGVAMKQLNWNEKHSPEEFCKKTDQGVLNNFAKFTVRHLSSRTGK